MTHFIRTVMESIIGKLFQFSCLKPTIAMSCCQKQKDSTDCGLFAITNYATAIAFGKNPCKLQLKQASKQPLGLISQLAN